MLEGIFRFPVGESRLYSHFVTLTSLLGSVVVAISCRFDHHRLPKDSTMEVALVQFPHLCVRFPYVSPIENVSRGIMVGATEVRVIPFVPLGDEAEDMGTTGRMFSQIGGLVFANFYEENVGWLIEHFGSIKDFPLIWQFARIVRNAVSHGGKINISSPSAPRGEWHSLSYGYEQSGRHIINSDLGVSDLTVLMIELAQDLESRGAPVPPWAPAHPLGLTPPLIDAS